MSDGNGHATFVGPGFGTLQPLSSSGDTHPPAVVSRRATLRRAMPSIYHDPDLDETLFALRFVGALETLLDPIAALLDSLPEHFSADHAPQPMIDMLAAWLCVEFDEAQKLDARRETLRRATDLGRWRGTVRGLELALRLTFPGIPMRVEDDGGVRWSLDGAPAKVEPPRFVVYVDMPIPEDRQVAVARCIDRHKPVQATYRLRVKTANADTGSNGGQA
jgi:phage tail-like protein